MEKRIRVKLKSPLTRQFYCSFLFTVQLRVRRVEDLAKNPSIRAINHPTLSCQRNQNRTLATTKNQNLLTAMNRVAQSFTLNKPPFGQSTSLAQEM